VEENFEKNLPAGRKLLGFRKRQENRPEEKKAAKNWGETAYGTGRSNGPQIVRPKCGRGGRNSRAEKRDWIDAVRNVIKSWTAWPTVGGEKRHLGEKEIKNFVKQQKTKSTKNKVKVDKNPWRTKRRTQTEFTVVIQGHKGGQKTTKGCKNLQQRT